ncbi:MAG TPA: hypothetical protein VFR34_11005, partial [Paracoccaceae bacterium]|nr:hypothetical protein [Paracoccaceae bacterium]
MARSAIRRGGGTRFGTARRSQGEGAWLWWLLIVISVLAMAAGFFAVQWVRRSGQIDAATLCPADGPAGVLVAVLDLTDPLSPAQSARLRGELQREIEASPAGTMISVGLVSADPANWGARFALCKPREGKEASELYENPGLIAERYEKGFREPLDATLGAMIGRAAEKSSPIMEGLQAVIAATPGFADSKGSRRLLVASDLLQHSEVLSFYRGEDWEHFAASRDFTRLAGNLEGVEVLLLRVPRPQARIAEPAAVEDFWANYFDHQLAASVRSRVL